ARPSPLSGNPDIFDVGAGVTATFRNLILTQTAGGAAALDNLGGTPPGTPNGGPVLLDQMLIATNTLANGVATGLNSFTTVQNTTMNANQVGLSVTDPSASVSLDNVTISSNTGGGIGNVNGGNVNLTNTIVALNTPGGDCATPVTSSVSSLDNTGATSSCGVQIHSTTNPLGGQADNGGPTPTRAITAAGPAFNVGTGAPGSATCPATDQRGFARETGRNCDLGAYGVIRADLAVTKTGPASVTAGATVTYPITGPHNGPRPTQEARISDALPAELTFVSTTPSQGSCQAFDPIARQLICPFGPLASGASATASIVVTAPSTTGTVTNTATVSTLGRA